MPATLSPTIIADIIRGEIGFDGLLMTDDIAMEALSGPLGGARQCRARCRLRHRPALLRRAAGQ